MASSTTSYLDPANITTYVDWNTLADLLSDTGAALASENAVTTNTKLAKFLKAVSGKVESQLCNDALGPARYTVADLQGLSGVAKELFNDLLSRLTACELYDRRPDKSPANMPVFYNTTLAEFAALAAGDWQLQL